MPPILLINVRPYFNQSELLPQKTFLRELTITKFNEEIINTKFIDIYETRMLIHLYL